MMKQNKENAAGIQNGVYPMFLLAAAVVLDETGF